MRLGPLLAAGLRRLVPAEVPPTPREARARRAFEVVTATAIAVGAAALLLRPAPPAAGPTWASLPVDVATDGASRLRLLPGIGPARLRAILRDRAVSGPVPSLEALDRVPGLGPKTVDALRRAGATVGRGAAPTTTGAVAADGRDAAGGADAGRRTEAVAGP